MTQTVRMEDPISARWLSQTPTGEGSVGTSAVLASGRDSGKAFTIVIADADNSDVVYVGGEEVTASTGYPLVAGQHVPIPGMAAVYVIGGAASQGYRILTGWKDEPTTAEEIPQ